MERSTHETRRTDIRLRCGHEFPADRLDNPQRRHRRKVECPGGCGWQEYDVVKTPIPAGDGR